MPSRVIPEAWLPRPRNVQRVILHWSAGAYQPSLIDRAHYHFLVSGAGEVSRGVRGPGYYLPHTRNLNTGSVGLAICAMAGAVQAPFRAGAYPLLNLQWERAAQACADLVAAYQLGLSERTVLTHSEVTRVYGQLQRGKWDIDALPFAPELTAGEVHQQFRRKVAWYLTTYYGR